MDQRTHERGRRRAWSGARGTAYILVGMAAVDVVDRYVSALAGAGGETRRLDAGEWGITVRSEATGEWPLDVGLRLADGLLRAQAHAVGASDALNPWNLLHWNRQTRMVRFACTRDGDIWVHGDLPAAAVDEVSLDRLLGLVAEAAIAARRLGAEPPHQAAPQAASRSR